ncbi:phosphoheptose isomerase [Candidatus Aerophobetes bacterium]|uniref:Phosphoheptose isomerase n=1 Tax=Aerophobetes bacterium TaxID=2030807 RepID=A0A2A4X1X2_UNCAE|nr:MAG: phosphoheptose isomerase [Candidatus Aerophobetes bacterium]
MEEVACAIVRCYKKKGKVLIAGNGGSLCDAMHFAEELTAYYRKKRPALPAIALADPGHITAVGNDTNFDKIFERGVEALGQPGDVFVALTTSGNSKNIVLAVEKAKEMGLTTVGFLGKSGGILQGKADLEWIVKGFDTSDRIQEVHMAAIHMIIECVEYALFYKDAQIDVDAKSAQRKIGV